MPSAQCFMLMGRKNRIAYNSLKAEQNNEIFKMLEHSFLQPSNDSFLIDFWLGRSADRISTVGILTMHNY